MLTSILLAAFVAMAANSGGHNYDDVDKDYSRHNKNINEKKVKTK